MNSKGEYQNPIELNPVLLRFDTHSMGQVLCEFRTQTAPIFSPIESGLAVKTIAQNLKLKTNRVVSEWSRVYLVAQSLRGVPEAMAV